MSEVAVCTSPAREKTISHLTYVLITPARNEEAFVEQTIKSVVSQTIRPVKWVIVSDGSTDRTDEIVQRYTDVHDWIELVRTPVRTERHFAGKVYAFDTGAARVRHLPYDIIGNLDADVSFEADYIEYLLGKFTKYPRLGVASTNHYEEAWEKRPRYDFRFTSIEDVSGACQLFRRACFESIGGYKPSKHGGVDLLATVEARMHGWQTRVYTGKLLLHHRQQGTVKTHPFLVEFYNGRKDYMFGAHPFFEICRALYRLTRKPYVIGGCLIVIGYFSALFSGTERIFPEDVMRFRRKEQMNRLWALLRTTLSLTRLDSARGDEEPR
jgi:poly-beta-1,6-N-acetyl-D-glucosamine synthase